MATPQDLTTTVGGRRCTRSRARTAATSVFTTQQQPAPTPIAQQPPPVISSAPEQIQQTSAAPPPPPPPPPASSQEQQAAAPSAPGTAIPAVSSSAPLPQIVAAPPPSAIQNLNPSGPVAIAPNPGVVITEDATPVAAAPETPAPAPAPISTAPPPAPTSAAPANPEPTEPTSSDPIVPAATSSALLPSSSAPRVPATSAAVVPTPISRESSIEVIPGQPEQSSDPAAPSSSNEPSDSDQPSNDPFPVPTSSGAPTGGSAGVISPETGSDDSGGLTLGNGPVNVGAVVGGVVGGVAAICLISALLFLCLRKRKSSDSAGRWQRRFNEKNAASDTPGFMSKLKAIPAGAGMWIEKLKGKKSGPAQHPYRRHSARTSVSSVYSVGSNGRSRSVSEPQFGFRDQLRGFGDRMPSLKRSRTLLQKKPDSLVVGDRSPFPAIVEDPVIRDNQVDNPFADPLPQGNLQLRNPDGPRQSVADGLRDQQRGPISPKPVLSTRGSRDPFVSIMDELEERNGSGTPEWLRDTSHRRTHSATTALRSHPPSSFYSPSALSTADNPFLDSSAIPPMPTQPLPPNPPRQPPNTYNRLPTFDALSTGASRDSNSSFILGEPGPSRPTTNMYSNPPVVPRAGRQSDPFDLDRPEVLGFGSVRRDVRGSVTRQNSRSRRTSSVPNWVNFDGTGPLRNPSVKR
ncbi:hypothetical protein B0J11DRAFT_82547 [Dendryphion nanum]|uniref:Uncharacterized protein n=1 Tax=Dendryphion nanum TaxID=256645 RepID=A0A9P9DHG9_9PLEO|nr:hypothetical protein B0J11DRAFT_82547 [Dendryphion nanum]